MYGFLQVFTLLAKNLFFFTLKLTKNMIWHKLSDRKPIATQTGGWDGFKSAKVLVATRNEGIYVAEMYEGTQDGSKFCDFYDHNDFEIFDVVKWTEIDNPF
jgi:hypothetical protein